MGICLNHDTIRPVALSDWSAAEHIKLYRESLLELIRLADYTGKVKEDTKDSFYFLYNTMKDDICRKCVRFRTCFGTEQVLSDTPLYDIVCRELSGDEPEPEMEYGLSASCIYYGSLKEELVWLRRLLFQKNFWENRFHGIQRAYISSLLAQKVMLDECIKTLESSDRINRPVIRKLNRFLFPGGLVRSGRQWSDQDGNFEVLLEMQLFYRRKLSDISEQLSKIYGQPMICSQPDEWIAAGRRKLQFCQVNTFNILFGKCHRNKTGETVSGDTFSYIQKKSGQVLLCLSDGMGTGEKARMSSARLLEAFEALAIAGITEEAAVDMLHSLLFLQTGNELSTLDIAAISLKSGVARFIKAGGAATFIRRRCKVERLGDAGLPPGFLEGHSRNLQSCRRKLYDGDMIIMLSDGMLSFENENGESMENLMGSIRTDNAQSFADRLMELIPGAPEGTDDDRTVLVAVMREKRSAANVGRTG